MGEQRTHLPNVEGASEPRIAHHLDDWGPEGGHDWPRWNHQMWEYVGMHF